MKKLLLWVCKTHLNLRKGYLLILFFWDAWEVTIIEQIGHVFQEENTYSKNAKGIPLRVWT
jgi:hypothetical protein